MNSKTKIGIGVALILLVILAIAGLSVSDDSQSVITPTDEPLSETSELDSEPNYLASESILIGVSAPNGETPAETTDPEPQQPSSTPTPTTPSQPSTPVITSPPSSPVIEPPAPPPTIGPGDPNTFSVSSYSTNYGPIGNESSISQHGHWLLPTSAANNGVSEFRINTRLAQQPANGSYRLNIFLKQAGSQENVIIGLHDNIFSLVNGRGAFFEMRGANNAESPSGIVTNEGDGTLRTGRLLDWSAGVDYELAIVKDTSRSNGSVTWWNGLVRPVGGSELLIGSIQTPTSNGNLIVRTSYIERWGSTWPITCSSLANIRANFSNLRLDGQGAFGVAVSLRAYDDCNGVHTFNQFSNNGYTGIINPGS